MTLWRDLFSPAWTAPELAFVGICACLLIAFAVWAFPEHHHVRTWDDYLMEDEHEDVTEQARLDAAFRAATTPYVKVLPGPWGGKDAA